MTYAQPTTLDEALGLLQHNAWSILSGGTDWYPSVMERPLPGHVMDIHALNELRGITLEDGYWRIGAGVTWCELMAAALPPAFNGLKLAAAEIGSIQIQNRATLVGNLCNASPAADGVPPLLTLDAEIELRSASGTRRLALRDFVLGNRQTARRQDEIVTAILIPASAAAGVSGFRKLGARKYLVISVSMVAARLLFDEAERISAAAVSVGSCSLVACRLTTLEAALIGQSAGAELGDVVTPEHIAQLAPISDIRSTAEYRMHASLELVRRLLNDMGSTFAAQTMS